MATQTKNTVLFLTILATFGQMTWVQAQECDSVLDLVLVLDSSNSLTRSDWRNIKNTVSNVVQQLKINTDQIQVGIVEFASSVGATIPITGDKTGLMAAIQNLDKTDTGTGTNLAIEAALRLLDASRADIPDAMVIVTDGSTDNVNATEQQVRISLARNVPIFAIGIGVGISRADLVKLTGGREDRVKTTNSTTELLETLNNVTLTVCEQIVTTVAPTTTPTTTTTTTTTTTRPTTTTTTTTTPPPPACEIQSTNIWLAVDQSSSALNGVGLTMLQPSISSFIGTREFNRYLSSSGLKVGIVSYGLTAGAVISSPLNTLANAVVLFPPPGQSSGANSGTYSALERLQSQTPESNMANWIIVISPGGSPSATDQTRAIATATLLKSNGYMISVIGVGAASTLNEVELRGIASDGQYTRIDTYFTLPDALYNFVRNRLCNQINNPCTKCVYDSMINIVPASDTCSRFYMCLPNYSYVVKDCPAGTLFNDQAGHRTCEFLPNFSCPSWGQCTSGRQAKFPALCCGEYYECNNGAVDLKQCPNDRPLFNSVTKDCVANIANDACLADFRYCRTTSPRELDQSVCNDKYRASTEGKVCEFEQKTADGKLWLTKQCAIGTGWNQTKCTCDHNPVCLPIIPTAASPRSNDVCAAKFHLTFNATGTAVTDDVTNTAKNTWVEKNKVLFSPRSAAFRGRTGQENDLLYIPFFVNFWWRPSFAFKIKFRLGDSAQLGVDYDVLANDRCGQCDPSIYLRARRGSGTERTVTLRVTDIANTVVTLTGTVNINQASDWLQVTFTVQNRDVAGKVDVIDDAGNTIVGRTVTLSASTGVTRLVDRVKTTICGMALGQGPVNALIGDVQDFQYVECDAPTSRLL